MVSVGDIINTGNSFQWLQTRIVREIARRNAYDTSWGAEGKISAPQEFATSANQSDKITSSQETATGFNVYKITGSWPYSSTTGSFITALLVTNRDSTITSLENRSLGNTGYSDCSQNCIGGCFSKCGGDVCSNCSTYCSGCSGGCRSCAGNCQPGCSFMCYACTGSCGSTCGGACQGCGNTYQA